jgi:Zn-dependent protease with chaperone function
MKDVYLATMISLATAAFGVVAALAWNAFIVELVKQVLGVEGGLIGLLIYAVVVTILAVIVVTWLGRMAERAGAKPGI